MLNWQRLTAASWQALLADMTLIEQDAFGPKVLRAADASHYLKVFRIKRKLSSGILNNPARRFCANAVELARRGIPTLTPTQLYRIDEIERFAVGYQPLAGDTVRHLLKIGAFDQDLIAQLAAFIYQLHRQGIYFRSLHPGNVVVTPDGKFGLIDVLDMKFRWFKRPLTAGEVKRNFQHFLRYDDGKQIEVPLLAAYKAPN